MPEHVVEPVSLRVGEIVIPAAVRQLRKRPVAAAARHLEIAGSGLQLVVAVTRETQELVHGVVAFERSYGQHRPVLRERLGDELCPRPGCAHAIAPPGVRGLMREQRQVAILTELGRPGHDEPLLRRCGPGHHVGRDLGDGVAAVRVGAPDALHGADGARHPGLPTGGQAVRPQQVWAASP